MNNLDKELKKMYKDIDTPEYNVKQGVLNKINKVQTIPKVNRKVLIAAVLCLVVLLAGTAAAAGLIGDYQLFDFYGNSVPENTILPSATPTNDNRMHYENLSHNFTLNPSQGEVKVAYYELSGQKNSSMSIGTVEIDNYDELKNYISNSNSYFMIPKYIPEGYTFKNAYTHLYLDLDSLESKMIFSENEETVKYRIYKLPEGYENKISSLYINFEDGDGNLIEYSAYISYRLSKDVTMEFGAPASATAAKIKVPGFKQSILIHDDMKEYDWLNQVALYNEIPPIETANWIFSMMCQGEDISDYEVHINKYDAMIYQITGENLSEDEITKIAENLK